MCKLVTQFHDKVLTFIHDPNGNHVIQRCIQVMSAFADDRGDPSLTSSLSDRMQFIVDDIVDNIEMLSTHRYGCRVVQRAVEHCEDAHKNAVLEKIVSCHESLIVDHYGEDKLLSCPMDFCPISHRFVLLKLYLQAITSYSKCLCVVVKNTRLPFSRR